MAASALNESWCQFRLMSSRIADNRAGRLRPIPRLQSPELRAYFEADWTRSSVHCLVQSLGSPKTQVPVKTNGGVVLGGDFQISSPQPCVLKTRQCAVHEGTPQADAPVVGDDTEILDRTDGSVVHHSLHGSDIPLGTGDQ